MGESGPSHDPLPVDPRQRNVFLISEQAGPDWHRRQLLYREQRLKPLGRNCWGIPGDGPFRIGASGHLVKKQGSPARVPPPSPLRAETIAVLDSAGCPTRTGYSDETTVQSS